MFTTTQLRAVVLSMLAMFTMANAGCNPQLHLHEGSTHTTHVMASEPAVRAPAPAPTPHTPARATVVNGDFETPALDQGTWQVLQLPGWTVRRGSGIELQNHAAGSPAQGNQFIELDAHGPTDIYQDVQTEPGGRYELRLLYAPRPNTPEDDNTIEVWFGGKKLTTLRASGMGHSDPAWIHVALPVIAEQNTSRIEFRYTSPANGYGGYLDAVSLEPAEG